MSSARATGDVSSSGDAEASRVRRRRTSARKSASTTPSNQTFRSGSGTSSAAKKRSLSSCQRSSSMEGVRKASCLVGKDLRQPCACHAPLPVDRRCRQFEDIRCLFDRIARKESTLDYADLPRITGFEALQGVIEFHHLCRIYVARIDGLVKGEGFLSATPLQSVPLVRGIHKDLPHGPGRNAHEVPSALNVEAIGAAQLQVGFVNECGRIERLAGPAAPYHSGEPPQFIVHECEELIQHLRLVRFEGFQQLGEGSLRSHDTIRLHLL